MGTASDPAELIDGARIAARLDTLWDVARTPGGGADRPAWSPAEAAAMRLVAGWAADGGPRAGARRARQPLGAAARRRAGRHVRLARRHRARRRSPRRGARDRARAR